MTSHRRWYADVVLHHLEAAARQALEREMALELKNKYEYESVTFRRAATITALDELFED